MKSNLDNYEVASNSNKNFNMLSSVDKMSGFHRLDSRMKSVMPELKGKSNQKYLYIKVHKSFEDSKNQLVRNIKQGLENLTTDNMTQQNLNNYIQWNYFSDTKQLLKVQYQDNELYYIIVPQKYLSWAQTFATQQRQQSQNKKLIHVIGIMKDSAFIQKQKLKNKKRFDKIPDYIHHLSSQRQTSRDIVNLISLHLEQRIIKQNNQIKAWALTNKYAQKKIKKRTIHVYYDESDKDVLQKLYMKYNPKLKSSWLQIHPYNSFYEVVKNIKQRQSMSSRQARQTDKLTSRLIQSKSQIELGSMKSFALLDNSQLMNTSVLAVNKLDQDDVNIIIAKSDFEQLDKLKAFIKAQKIKNWQLIEITSESPDFYKKIAQIFKRGEQLNHQYDQQQQKHIIKSKTLHILCQTIDQNTKSIFLARDNVFHNMELFTFNNSVDFAYLLRKGVKSKDDYTIAVVPGGANSFNYQYQKEIKQFMKQYKNTQVIDNFSFISTSNGRHESVIGTSYQNNLNLSKVYQLANSDEYWLQKLMIERDLYFHPFKGLKGCNVYLLVKATKQDLLAQLRDYVTSSPRLQISTYIDKQYLAKMLKTIQIKDSAIVITDDEVLRQAQQVLINFDEVFIMNITNRTNLKEQTKVFAWGTKQTIYQLIKQIPELDHRFQYEVYNEDNKNQRKSLLRQNRILPKKIQFAPGNTIAVRLPADLADQQSRKMQVRLKKYFNQQIKIEYYKDPSDIRLRNKLEEPLSFIICRNKDKQLDYMKTIAKKQIQQKREEFILYDEKPEQFKYLIEDKQYDRFRFLSNRWADIEDYIIKTYGLYVSQDSKQSIYQDQLIHIFSEHPQSLVKDEILNLIDYNVLKSPNNCRFYQIQQMEQILSQYPPNHKYYLIIDQNNSNLRRQDGQKIINSFKASEPTKEVSMIVMQQGKLKRPANYVKGLFSDQQAASNWISSIKVLPINNQQSRPYIIIDHNSLDWQYFLHKYSNLTGSFRYIYVNSRQQMRKQIQNIRYKDPGQQIWILSRNLKDFNDSLKVAQKIQSGRGIRIILHGDQQIKLNNDPKNKIIFANQDYLQVQKFILNPFRRSYYQFFPSSVINKKVILAIQTNLIKKIKANEMKKWQQILKSTTLSFKNFEQLQRIRLNSQGSTIYAVIDSDLEQYNKKQLNLTPQVKRIVVNQKNTYNPRFLGKDFKQNNGQLFMASYGAEASEYLKYLRYNIRNSERQIQKRINKQLIEVYCLKSNKINDRKTLNYILAKNDSLVKYNLFQSYQGKDMLQKATNYDYHTVFVGDNSVSNAVYDTNKRKNTKFKFINGNFNPPYNSPQSTNNQLETNQNDQVKMYLYNLPENRYDRARNHKGKFVLYYDKNSQNAKLLKIVDVLNNLKQRNKSIDVRSYSDPLKLNQQIKQQSVVIIPSEMQAYYQKNIQNSNINYLILNEDEIRNLTSYGNKHFINKENKCNEQYTYFFENVLQFVGGDIEPLPFAIDNSINQILANITNYNSYPVNDQYAKLGLHPPFQTKNNQTENIPPIVFNQDMFDLNPPQLLSGPMPIANAPTLHLGLDLIEKIKKKRISKQKFTIQPPLMDIPPSQNGVKIYSEPDKNFTTLSVLPSIPAPPQPKTFNLCVLYPDTPQFHNIGSMLKSNLEPQQFKVNLISFKNEHQLQEYSRNQAQKLNGYDKIVVFLSNLYRRYDNILRTMKSKMNNRMQYFIFDDYFHIDNHQILKHHLRPYRIRKIKIPYQSDTLPKYWNLVSKFNIFVSPQNRKYDYLKNEHVSIINYRSKQDIQNYLHYQGVFQIIVCNKQNYHQFKQFPKISPRCILLVQDSSDLYEDQFLFYRFPTYSIYYGPDGSNFLKNRLPKNYANATDLVRILYYYTEDEPLVFYNYQDYAQYEKCKFDTYSKLYQYIVIRYKSYSNWLLKNSPVKPQLIPLAPKVYLENQDFMIDYKNNYVGNGYRNQEIFNSKSQIVLHQFYDLPEVYYQNMKDLIKYLEKQETPCVVLINGSDNKMLSVIPKFRGKHIFKVLINDFERWIQPDGSLPSVNQIKLRRKQDLFVSLFNEAVFDAYNDMQYYYLSNKANIDHKRNIYFRTKQDLIQIFKTNPNLLMIVFVQSCDTKHIPTELLNQFDKPNGRVKLIYLQTQFKDHDTNLYVKFNEIDPVIKHINDVENAGRIDFIIYNQSQAERLRHSLISKKRLKNIDSKPYNSMMDIQNIAYEIKGKFKMVYVICFPEQITQIQSILLKYAIKDKGIPGEGVEFIPIDRKSQIQPGSSYVSPRKTSYIQNNNVNYPNDNNIGQNYFLNATSAVRQDKNIISSPNNNRESPQIKSKSKQKSQNLNLDDIIQSKNYILSIDQRIKNKVPVGRLYANKIQYFSNIHDIPVQNQKVPRIIISNSNFNDLQDFVNSNYSPSLLIYVVPPNDSLNNYKKANNNILAIKQPELQSFIKKLQGNQFQDELNIKNIDDYELIRIIYDKNIDPQQKRKLLSASYKNKKILPTIYKGVDKIKQYVKEPNSLVILMMSQQPIGLQEKVKQDNYQIVRRKKMRMILPNREDQVDGLQTILQEDEIDNDNSTSGNFKVRDLSEQEVDIYLKLIQKRPENRDNMLINNERQRSSDLLDEGQIYEDNITKLNVHSNIRPQNMMLFREEQIQKIKQRLDGNLIVLIIQHSKKDQVQDITNKYNILVQNYTNAMNLENDIRDRKDAVTIAVINKNMIQKIIPIKKKYQQVTFILQNDTPQQQLVESYRPYIAGQIKKMSDLQKIIGDLYSQNERIRYNQQSMRAASRFQNRKTSIVDFSNNQRFSVGFNNQKSKKAFLFYKQPQNNHVKMRLQSQFNNISCIPYKSIVDLKKSTSNYGGYTSIIIANGNDIPQIEDYVSKKKQQIYLIRFNAPEDIRDTPKVKRLFSTYDKHDLQQFIYGEFQKISNNTIYERLDQKYKSPQIQAKRYTQKYEPNTFGTTPRFPGDFVPPKSKESTYSRRYMKSTSRSKVLKGQDSLKSRNFGYYQG